VTGRVTAAGESESEICVLVHWERLYAESETSGFNFRPRVGIKQATEKVYVAYPADGTCFN
jgi:hypothetical protein